MTHKCSKCEYKTGTSTGLAIHMARRHGTVGKRWGNGKPKRRYKRKDESEINFCPCCGTNLRAVKAAVNL